MYQEVLAAWILFDPAKTAR